MGIAERELDDSSLGEFVSGTVYYFPTRDSAAARVMEISEFFKRTPRRTVIRDPELF